MTPIQLIAPAVSGWLPNGLKYIIQPDTANPVLCLQLYVRIGSAWETALEAGYAHFLEHLVFKSTSQFGYNQIMQYVNGMGGSINAYTDFDCTCFYLNLPAENIAGGLQVLAELAVRPTFTGSDVALEKEIISEEIRESRNDPEADFLDHIQISAWTTNPLRKLVLGTPASIRAASKAKLAAFHHKYYQPQNSFLVLTGDLDPGTVPALLEQYFGAWPGHSEPVSQAPGKYLEPEPPAIKTHCRKRNQEFLAYVLPELADSHPASDALHIALRYLALGRSSRLFTRLVEEEHLCSSVKTLSYSGVLSGVSVVLMQPTRPQYLQRIDAIFQSEYRALLEGKQDPSECELIKRDIVNTWRYGFEGTENLANMIGAEEFNAGFEKLFTYDQSVQAITVEDVKRSISKYWQASNLMVFHQAPHPVLLHNANPDRSPKRRMDPPSPYSAGLQIPQTRSSKGKLGQIADDYYSCILACGLRLLLRRVQGRPITGFALAANVSQLAENESQRGLNFLTSTAMLHSSQLHSHRELMTLSRDHGISLNVEQHLDTTVFAGKCFQLELATALPLLAEIVHQPAFETPYLNTIKSATADLLRRERQNPAGYAFFRWLNMLLGARSHYGRSTGGISDLYRHTRQDLLNWHQSMYRPDLFTLAVVGAIEPQEVLDDVSALFAVPASTTFASAPAQPGPRPAASRTIFHRGESSQAIIYIGGMAPPATDQLSTTAFYLLAQILGGDMDSRLFNIVREKYGYAYQTGFDFTSVLELGYWYAWAYCDRNDYRHCLKLMREILAEVYQHGVNAEELLQAQNYLCGSSRFERENSSLHATLIATLTAVGYDPLFYYRREERIRSTGLDQISSLARTWLQPDNQWTFVHL